MRKGPKHDQGSRTRSTTDFRGYANRELQRYETMMRTVVIGAAVIVLGALTLTGLAKFTDWLGGLFVPSIPAGAVVAFDQSEGCPKGWASFDDSRGRFLVGASKSGEIGKDENGVALTHREFRESGGTEAHTLTELQLPPHKHQINTFKWGYDIKGVGHSELRIDVDDGPAYRGSEGRLTTDSSKASGEPHNNMPPYIALYFCKKGK